MLEALIRVSHRGDRGRKKRGDVVEVRLSPAVWTDFEKRYHLIVEWTDAPLERAMRKAREDRRAMPYSETIRKTTDGVGGEREEITNPSSESVDLVDIKPSLRNKILDPMHKIDRPIRVDEYKRKTRRG